jgi:hypothetical protein
MAQGIEFNTKGLLSGLKGLFSGISGDKGEAVQSAVTSRAIPQSQNPA